MLAPCDRARVEIFDYARLSDAFSGLSKPAKRALINNGILEPRDLARYSRRAVAKLHGIGPSVFPVLTEVLRAEGLDFKA